MRDVDAGVDDRDRDARTARRDGPRLLGVDVRVGRARREVHRLARVVEAPLLREGRVIRRGGGVEDEVRLRVGDPRVLLECANRPVRVRRAHGDDGAVDLREVLRRPSVDCAEHTGPPLGRDVRLEADDDRARDRSRSSCRVLPARRARDGSGDERRGQSGGEDDAWCWATAHGVRAERPARAEQSASSERRAEPRNRPSLARVPPLRSRWKPAPERTKRCCFSLW